MIEAKNLKKVYKTKKGVVVNALDGVSVKLPDTGMVFILGKSGSGKSTLLNVLGGLDSFDSGEIIIKGKSAKDFKQSHYDSYRNTYIGFIFQEYNILEELTVGANIALAIELQGRRATNEEIDSILTEVDLGGLGQRKPNELSGGQKQRVAIARALVKKPEIIMADEPTGALDSVTGKQVFDTLKKLSRDKLVLIVSHDREFSEQYADRIIELKDGEIISDVERIDTGGEICECDDPLEWGDGEITVRGGYELTEEDRLAINEYLRSHAEGAVIKPRGKGRRVTAKDFKPTDEGAIASEKQGGFKLIKSKLSMKNAFKLGSGALNYKKVRLGITIFLSLISFTLFGLADTIAAYNDISTTTSSIYDTGVDYASFVKQVKVGSDDYEYWDTRGAKISEADIETIERETGKTVIGVYKGEYKLDYGGNIGDGEEENKSWSMIYNPMFSGLVGLDNRTLLSLGFELEGRLPIDGAAEIVITKYAYEYFEKAGYATYTSEGKTESDITKPSDLIGKKLNLDIAIGETNAFEIVGIVDTRFDLSRYEALADDNATRAMNMLEIMMMTLELESAQNYSFASIGFVSPSFIDGILKENAGAATGLDGIGNISFYKVIDDTGIEETGNIWGEDGKNNVLFSAGFRYMNSLENVKDYVYWCAEELDTLEKNQVILPIDIARTLATGVSNGYYDDVMHEPTLLIGVEKTMFEEGEKYGMYVSGLSSILYNVSDFAAIAFVIENYDEARAAVVDYYVNNNGYDSTSAEEMVTSDVVKREFVQIVRMSDDYADLVDVNAYIQGLRSRYECVESLLLSESLREAVVTEFTYNGSTYYSYPANDVMLSVQLDQQYRDILKRSFAAAYLEDALAFYKLCEGLDPEYVVAPEELERVLYTYGSYAEGENVVDGFTPKSAVTLDEYEATFLLGMIEAGADSGKYVVEAYSYSNWGNNYIRDIEIVGLIGSDAPDMRYESTSRIVVSSEIMNILYGGTDVSGTYAFALGAMPESQTEIRDLVTFSKRYEASDGKVRYHLTNNVTDQLDMVEEILDILGQVFLYVGIGFAVFASLMLANFITTSIAHKKQDIGILRAIGSRSNDVFRIFFAESFIIAMINYVLSLIATFAVTTVINGALREEAGLLITFLNFGIRQVGVLLLVSIGVAFVATFLPVKRIASMKPIDAIKNRK